jgi:hypothetical protein
VTWAAIKLLVVNFSSWPVLFCAGFILGCVADECAEVFQMCSCWSIRGICCANSIFRVAWALGQSVQPPRCC